MGCRAVASLTVPGGQETTFLIFSSNFDQFFLFFLKLYLFSSSFLPSGWASHPPKKALATPLVGCVGGMCGGGYPIEQPIPCVSSGMLSKCKRVKNE